MADVKEYRLKAVKADAVVYSSVRPDSFRMSRNAQEAVEASAGRINVDIIATLTVEPIIEFDLFNIAQITAPTEVAALLFTLEAQDSGGYTGSGKISVSAKALLVPVRISGSAGSPAMLTLRAYILSSDGSTAPFTVGTTDITIATADQIYTVGASTVNSTAVEGITSQAVDWGFNVATDVGLSGYLYPTHAFIQSAAPVATFSTRNAINVVTATVNAGTELAANAAAVIWDDKTGSTDKTFSLAKGLVTTDISGGTPSTVELKVTGQDSDTTDTTFVVAS